jgi:uncharacterized protein (TIGR02118 family)
MVKVVAVISRKPGLDRAEFLRHWQQDHPAYVRTLPHLRRYVQNPAVEGYRTWPYDGVAELWFDSVRDVAAAFDSPQATTLREHEENFIGELHWFLADEHEVSLDPVEAP